MEGYKFINRFPIIETERLVLRRLTLKDRFDLMEIFSDEDVMKYYGIYTIHEVSRVENLILDYDEGFINNSFIRWGIELKENNKIIGTCGFHNWMKSFAKCELGYEMNKDYWNKGLMKESLKAVIEYAFSQMNINRIEAQTYPENVPSFKLLEKMGFQREGLLRECAFFRDKFQDLYMYSLLKVEVEKLSEYQIRNQNIQKSHDEYLLHFCSSNFADNK